MFPLPIEIQPSEWRLFFRRKDAFPSNGAKQVVFLFFESPFGKGLIRFYFCFHFEWMGPLFRLKKIYFVDNQYIGVRLSALLCYSVRNRKNE